MAALPLHPRLAHMLAEAPRSARTLAADLAALLEERDPLASYDTIRAELAAYQPALLERREIVALNKIDLAPYVGASLEVMERDATRMRGGRPFVFTNLRAGQGLDEIERFLKDV